MIENNRDNSTRDGIGIHVLHKTVINIYYRGKQKEKIGE